MYLSSEGGLFGATGEIWPKAPSGWRTCVRCGTDFYSIGDHLCPACLDARDKGCRERAAKRRRCENET